LIESNGVSSLKRYLDTVLRVSEKKFSYNQKRDSQRIKWGRLIVNCVRAYAELIKNEELAQLRMDVDEIKAQLHITERLTA
jgi:hypothetical protein